MRHVERRPTAFLFAATCLVMVGVWAAVRAAYPIGWPIDRMPMPFLSLENAQTVAFVVASPLIVGLIAVAMSGSSADVSRVRRGLAAAAVFGVWLATITALRIAVISEALWIALVAIGALATLVAALGQARQDGWP